jgi:tetratricopeptide (TPR) repeat protein
MSEEETSGLMKQGIELMQSGKQMDALAYFDRALELRLQLPRKVPMNAYALAACWLNRAEALTRLGAEYLTLTLAAYDEAITLLYTLPLSEDIRFSRRLAIAQQNRALLLPKQEGIAALLEAIAVVEQAEAMPPRERDYLLAVAWLNLSNVRAEEGDARKALTLAKPFEHEEVVSAEIGIKCRHVLCQILSSRLVNQGVLEDVHEATDLAEEGLALAHEWERRGVQTFSDLAADLFRFGARVYARYQPRFLSEFLAEQARVNGEFDAR